MSAHCWPRQTSLNFQIKVSVSRGRQVEMESEMMKLEALLDYTVKHNSEHAEELKELAQKAKELGKTAVYDGLIKGVAQITEANETLAMALKRLRESTT